MGRSIGSAVGSNLASFTAELGGKVSFLRTFTNVDSCDSQAPVVVFNDANLQEAVNGAAFACFVASGQTCVSGTRLLLQDKIYDRFMERFLEKVTSIRARMGDRKLSL